MAVTATRIAELRALMELQQPTEAVTTAGGRTQAWALACLALTTHTQLLLPVVVVIEFISTFLVRPFSLMVRLFANLLAIYASELLPWQWGLSLTGPDGLLKQLTKTVLETALNEEMTEHLGHEKNQADPGRESTNVRNGSRGKTVLSDAAGEVQIDVPRDREGTFEPQIVKKRQRRLTEVDEIVLSLYAKGMTTGEISAHFAEIYGASVSKETVSRITDIRGWRDRLDAMNSSRP